MNLAPGTTFTVDDESTHGYTFTVRQVIDGTDMRILSCDSLHRKEPSIEPVVWGFPECAIDAWTAAGQLRIGHEQQEFRPRKTKRMVPVRA